jgi:xanthine/CO dehydrogenase XdhC/CoxF family maturation factor
VTSAQSLDPLACAQRWSAEGRAVAIATVVATWGSSPRPVGSQLVADSQGEFVGSVSGGCVEAGVLETATEVIATGVPRLVEFGVSDEMAWEVGLSCGGQILVFVERLG